MKNTYLFYLLLLCGFTGLSGKASAQELISTAEVQSVMISVEHAYIRATIPGTINSSAYMEIKNNGSEMVSLLSAYSNISERIEIHQHTMVDGMMRMRRVESIAIGAKDRVKLQPSGFHLMIFDVKNPLEPQQEVEITLNFSNNVSVTVSMPVYSLSQEQAAQKTVQSMHEHHH